MDKKILFISEVLNPPYDEGIKNIAFSLQRNLRLKVQTLSLTKTGNDLNNQEIVAVHLNKLFLNYELRKHIKEYSPNFILYLPESSITFNSFIRARILKLMNRLSKVVILGVKQVEYSTIQKKLIVNFLRPDLLLLLGNFDMGFFLNSALKVKIMPPAVDNARFCQATKEEKEKIRAEYGIPINKTVILHVGHIRSTRNVQCFLKIQEIENIQVVIVGSTSTPTENELKSRLLKNGVCVIDQYIPDIPKIYKMSDAYVFPVYNKIACIDLPLSILEAMACNLPVITTRFGSLENYFKEDDGFRFYSSDEDLLRLVRSIKMMGVHNDRKIRQFTWNNLANEVIAALIS